MLVSGDIVDRDTDVVSGTVVEAVDAVCMARQGTPQRRLK